MPQASQFPVSAGNAQAFFRDEGEVFCHTFWEWRVLFNDWSDALKFGVNDFRGQ